MRQQQSARAEPCGCRRRFTAGVSSADHDDVVRSDRLAHSAVMYGPAARMSSVSRETSDEKSCVEIPPVRVLLLNQSDLPIPSPLFDCLLTGNCVGRIVISFEPHQPVDGVPSGRARNCARFVLVHATHKSVRNAKIERSPAAGKVIDVIPASSDAQMW